MNKVAIGLEGAGGGERRFDGSGAGVGNYGTERQPAKKDDDKKKKKKRSERFQGGSAYPAYDRALTTQFKRNPQAAGVQRALGTGGLGAVLGALAARLISNNPAAIGGGALAGGALGAVPGYISGREEAKSDYSRLLFLRRRLGINEPGELEALLRHPEILAEQMKTSEALEKEAKMNALTRILLGAGVGGATGYWGTPHLGGYADVEPARRASGVIDATLGGIVGGLAHRAGGFGKLVKNIPTKALIGAPTAAGLGEMVPIGMATLQRTQNAMEDMSEAGKGLAQSAKVTSIPYNLQRVMATPAARGAGVGAAGAGIAALISGLLRSRSEKEILRHRGRGGMVGTDFMKYLLPAMLAGGVVGSLRKNTNTGNQ